MFKKLSIFLVSTITITCLYQFPVTAHLFKKDIKIINTQVPTLTEQQKEELKEKKEELKKKYLQNWKSKTSSEKKQSLQSYKKELDEFCQERYGLTYHDLKTKYNKYFKRLLPE